MCASIRGGCRPADTELACASRFPSSDVAGLVSGFQQAHSPRTIRFKRLGVRSQISMTLFADDDETASPSLQRSYADRHPVLIAFLLTEVVLIVLAGIIFTVGDPMSPDPTTLDVVGGLVVVIAVLLFGIGVVTFFGALLIRFYLSF